MEFNYDIAAENGNVFQGNVFIEYGAKIGHNNFFSNNCTIKADCIIGDDNYFGSNVCIGSPSRERLKGTCVVKNITERPKVIICNKNMFEDHVVIQTSLESTTKINNNVCIGAFTHISHDSFINDNVVIASHCSVGGYTILLERVNLGIGTKIHQRTVIGAYAMTGAGSVVVNHIVPFATVVGIPAHYLHINKIGLKRGGVSDAVINMISEWLDMKRSMEELPDNIIDFIKEFRSSIEIWKRNKMPIPNVKLQHILL